MDNSAKCRDIILQIGQQINCLDYYKSVFEEYEDEIDLFLCGMARNLFIRIPGVCNEDELVFARELAVAAIHNMGLRRSISQSLIVGKLPLNEADQRLQDEFYNHTPSRIAKYYNTFEGIYIVELPLEWTLRRNQVYFQKFLKYIDEQRRFVRFLIIVPPSTDCDDLFNSISKIDATLYITLKEPTKQQLLSYTEKIISKSCLSQSMKKQFDECIVRTNVHHYEEIKKLHDLFVWKYRQNEEQIVSPKDIELFQLLITSNRSTEAFNNTIGF